MLKRTVIFNHLPDDSERVGIPLTYPVRNKLSRVDMVHSVMLSIAQTAPAGEGEIRSEVSKRFDIHLTSAEFYAVINYLRNDVKKVRFVPSVDAYGKGKYQAHP